MISLFFLPQSLNNNFFLLLFKKKKDSDELGSINLLLCTVKTTVLGGAFFDVVTPTRTYHFQANSKNEMMSWLNHIRSASEKIYNELPHSTPQENSKSLSGFLDVTSVEIRTSQASTLTIQQSEENLVRIRNIQSLSKTCADCNSPSIFFLFVFFLSLFSNIFFRSRVGFY